METFIECFKIILTGDKETSRQAARRVRKILYGSNTDRGEYIEIKNIIENAPKEYANITENWRQENFVVAVSVIYYLHGRENQPDFLFSWLFYLLLHKNGNIRHSAVRMIEHELGPLTVHLRFPRIKIDHSFAAKQADTILYSMFFNLNDMLADLWKPAYKKYKYIDSLPAGPYKSMQMILGRMEDDCGEEYMKRMKFFYTN